MYLRRYIFFFLILVSGISISYRVNGQQVDPPFEKYMYHPWVDSVLNSLSLNEQIAQCIWIAAYSNRDISHEVEIVDIIRNYKIGGLVFFQGTPEKQAELTNFYQNISSIPLIIAMDAEWGLGMRLDNVDKFPYQMTLGAIQNDSLVYEMGKTVAEQMKRLGVHVNFAPVADINNNPLNPVINYRSFGENRENVASKVTMYMKGMQDNGILATAKHFPGHGDTGTDSHYDLPLINNSRERFDSLELYPFKRLINTGVGSIMSAHLSIPSLDTTRNLPSTLSKPIITGLLKNELGFKGIVVTDAMNMQGLTKYFKPGEAEAKAMVAGNDVLEFVNDVEAAIGEIIYYVVTGKLTKEEIALKCRKILALKYWSGLNNYEVIKSENITKELSPVKTKKLIRELYINSMTVLNNRQSIIPVKRLDTLKIATLAIGKDQVTPYQEMLSNYATADHFFINLADTGNPDIVLNKLKNYNLVIAGIFNTDQRPNMNFGIPEGLNGFIDSLIAKKRCIITYFGNAYAVNRIPSLQNAYGLIVTYQENTYVQEIAAQLVFGGTGASGTLPVTINENYPAGFGKNTEGNIRLQYGFPENEGIPGDMLNRKIDSIVQEGIVAGAFPGCEVMVARNGTVIFSKTYGYQTYDNRISVEKGDLYDLASLTKITGPLAGLMLLDDEGRFSPDEKLGTYLPEFRNSNKADLVLSDILTHQAGLKDWIPFWEETVRKNGKFKRNIFRSEYSENYPVEVAEGMFLNKNYRNNIFREIKKSKLGEKKYIYSDLGFILIPEIISNLTGENWYTFITDSIFDRLGANNIVFNPYSKFPLSGIVPTEYDSLFRKQLLLGTVHDEASAMLGGIAGHAGLFSTANDLMKVMELYRRMGNYGGEQIISKEKVEKYTKVQFPENNNRRGLGFDKPLLNNLEVNDKDAYPTKGASPSSFGHFGFTGTFAWVDPVYGLTFVFLCNRVYPTRNNNLLSELNIRTRILQVLYDSITEM
jgi:beta-N-acetylhexosaminidase